MKSLKYHFSCAELFLAGRLLFSCAAASVTSLLFTMEAGAQSATWTGGGGADTRWSIGANWSNGTPPVTDDILVFDGVGKPLLNDLAAPFTIQGITYRSTAGGFVFDSGDENQLVLRGGGITNESRSLQVIDLPLSFSAHQTINTGGGGIVLKGPLFSSNNTGTPGDIIRTITKSGGGELTLQGAAQYLNFELAEGSLVIGGNDAFGSGAGAGTFSIGNLVTVRGDGTARTIHNLIVFNAGTNGVATIGGASDLAFSGNITRLSSGTQEVAITNTGSTVLSGTISLNQTTSVVRGFKFNVAHDSAAEITGSLINGSTRTDSFIIKSGAGTLTLSGSNTYGGRTEVTGGRLVVDLKDHPAGVLYTDGVLSTSTLTVGGGTVELKGKNAGASAQTLGDLVLTGTTGSRIVVNSNGGSGTTFTLGDGWTRSGTANRQGSTLNIDLTAAGALLASNPALTNSILGYATVTDAGGTGFATVQSGQLQRYGAASALEAASNSATTNFVFAPTVGSPALAMNGGAKSMNSLAINTASGAGSLALTSGTLSLTSHGLLMTGANDFVIQSGGQVGASNIELLLHQYGSGMLTIAANVSGGSSGTVTKDGTGTVILSGTSIYQGATTVARGTLLVDGRLSSTSGVAVYEGAAFGGKGAVVSGVTLSDGGALESDATLSIEGGLTVRGGNNRLTNGTVNVAGAGVIESRSGFEVNGILGGAGNLSVSGRLDGTGTVNKAIHIDAGGMIGGNLTTGALSGSGSINPGNSPGLLTATQVDPTEGLSFSFDFTGKNAAPNWVSLDNDVLRLTDATALTTALDSSNAVSFYLSAELYDGLEAGDFLLGGIYVDSGDFLSQIENASFQVYYQDDAGYYFYNGQNYALMDFSAFSISTVANAEFAPSGYLMELSYSVVPEPQSLVMLFSGLGVLAWQFRRRRN